MSLNRSSALDPFEPGLPQGQVLGNFSTFRQAQELVDRVVDGGVAVENLSIVGRDTRVVTELRKHPGYPAVVARSAMTGAMAGIFLGILLMLLLPTEQAILQLMGAVVMGIAVWVIMGVIGHALRKRTTKYEQVARFTSVSFDVVCDFSAAAQARAILGRGPAPVEPGAPQASTAQQPSSPGFTPAQHQEIAGDQGGNQHGQQAGQSSEQPTEKTPARGGYEDLPDGRPQFGVRIDQQPTNSDQPSGPEQSGDARRPQNSDQPNSQGDSENPDQR